MNHAQADVLNQRLGILLGKIMSKVNTAIDTHTEIDVAQIRREVWSSDNEQTLIDWLADEVKVLSVTEETRKHYRTLVARNVH